MSVTSHSEFAKAVAGLTLAQRGQYHDALVARLSEQPPSVAKGWLDALAFGSSKGTREKRNLVRAIVLLKLLGGTLTTVNAKLEFANAIDRDQAQLAGIVRSLADGLFARQEVLTPAPPPPSPPSEIVHIPEAPPLPGITIERYYVPHSHLSLSGKMTRPVNYLQKASFERNSPFTLQQYNSFEQNFENIVSGLDAVRFSTDLQRYQTNVSALRDGAKQAFDSFNEALREDAKAAKKRVDILVGLLGVGLGHLPPPFGTFAAKALSLFAENFVKYSQEVRPWSNVRLVTTPTPSQQATAGFVQRVQDKITVNQAINTSSIATLGDLLDQLRRQVDEFVQYIGGAYIDSFTDVVGRRDTQAQGGTLKFNTTRSERVIEFLWSVHEKNPSHPRGDALITAATGYLTQVKDELKASINKLLKLGSQLPDARNASELAPYFEMTLWATVILDEFKKSDGKGKVSEVTIKRMSDLGLVEVWSQGFFGSFTSGTRAKADRARIFTAGKLRYHGSTHEKMMLQALAAYIMDIVDPVQIAFNTGREREINEKLAVYARTLTAHVENAKSGKSGSVSTDSLRKVQGDSSKFGSSVAAKNMPGRLT